MRKQKLIHEPILKVGMLKQVDEYLSKCTKVAIDYCESFSEKDLKKEVKRLIAVEAARYVRNEVYDYRFRERIEKLANLWMRTSGKNFVKAEIERCTALGVKTVRKLTEAQVKEYAQIYVHSFHNVIVGKLREQAETDADRYFGDVHDALIKSGALTESTLEACDSLRNLAEIAEDC